VKPIHLIGSGGFIGKAVQRQGTAIGLHCWSHSSENPGNSFDLLNSSSWDPLLRCKPETVILLSWPGLPNYQKSFHITQNLPAAVALVEQLIRAGIKRIVIAGTCYEYGLQNGPLQEDQPTNPVNLYAIAKDSLRGTVASLCAQHQVTWCWLRIFYPYGEGQNPKSLLPSLEQAIQAGEATFPMSSGRQLRDFLSVDEVANQLLLLAMHPKSSGIYNGGSARPRSLREVAEERIAALGSSIQITLGAFPDRTDEPLAFWADMTRLKQLKTNGQTHNLPIPI
jgi:dTDP-6-deoxy-L-talose 4-dehydrogenase (NAD+)